VVLSCPPHPFPRFRPRKQYLCLFVLSVFVFCSNRHLCLSAIRGSFNVLCFVFYVLCYESLFVRFAQFVVFLFFSAANAKRNTLNVYGTTDFTDFTDKYSPHWLPGSQNSCNSRNSWFFFVHPKIRAIRAIRGSFFVHHNIRENLCYSCSFYVHLDIRLIRQIRRSINVSCVMFTPRHIALSFRRGLGEAQKKPRTTVRGFFH
jgi:hypothetical protein